MSGILISVLANSFSSLLSGKKISFHRPVLANEPCWNLVKRILDHLWAILVVYVCIFFKIHWEIGCRCEKAHGEVYKAARDGSCFPLEAGLHLKEDRKRQKNSGMRITEGYLWQEMFITAGGKWSVCVYIHQTRHFAQHLLSLEMQIIVGQVTSVLSF